MIDYQALIAEVQAAKHSTEDLNKRIYEAVTGEKGSWTTFPQYEPDGVCPDYMGDISSAIDLVECANVRGVTHGEVWRLSAFTDEDERYIYKVSLPSSDDKPPVYWQVHEDHNKAIIIALLLAKQGQQND